MGGSFSPGKSDKCKGFECTGLCLYGIRVGAFKEKNLFDKFEAYEKTNAQWCAIMLLSSFQISSIWF